MNASKPKVKYIFLKAVLAVFGVIWLIVGAVILAFVFEGSFNKWFGEWIGDWVGIVVSGIFFIAGIACVTALFIIQKRAKIKFKQSEMLKSYVALIGNKKSVPIKWLAQKMNISQEQVIKDLYQAKSCGAFIDGHIDENVNILLFPNDNSAGTIKIVMCKNCGVGVEIIMGYENKCTYCGAALND